jgi:dolichol kinase
MKEQPRPLGDLFNQHKQQSANGEHISIIEYDYRFEVIRKAIHLFSLSIPLFYFVLPKHIALGILIPLTIAFLAVDVARYYNKSIEDWFYGTFGYILRKRESDKVRKTLNGATYVLIAATICVIVFPKIITVMSFSILIISDITAALVGRRFGKHPFIAKSLEGSIGFFISAVVVIAITPKIDYLPAEYIIGCAAALIGTIAEALPAEIDDNLTIPLSVGTVLWILYSLFLPALNLYKFG